MIRNDWHVFSKEYPSVIVLDMEEKKYTNQIGAKLSEVKRRIHETHFQLARSTQAIKESDKFSSSVKDTESGMAEKKTEIKKTRVGAAEKHREIRKPVSKHLHKVANQKAFGKTSKTKNR